MFYKTYKDQHDKCQLQYAIKSEKTYAKLILPNVYIWFITTCFSLHIADVFDLKIVLSNQGQHSLLHSHAFSRFLQKMTHLDFALNYYQTKV